MKQPTAKKFTGTPDSSGRSPSDRARGLGRRLPAAYAIATAAAYLLGMAGCAATGSAAGPMVVDQRAVVEGEVASVDLSPMAYDGDALIVVRSATQGDITVHLPARRNLCKAQGLDLMDELKPGERVRVEGVATGSGEIRLCQDAADRLQRIE